MLSPHAGAVLPAAVDRINNSIIRFVTEDTPDIYSILRSFYYDISGKVVTHHLEILFKTTEVSHMLYGSDVPYATVASALVTAKELDDTNKITDADRKLIYYENAKKLLGLSLD